MIRWLVYSQKICPDYRWAQHNLPKGDPRKSHLFKICYKMVRELEGNIKDEEIGLYIRSQLLILKAITADDLYPLIEPRILCSKKSWPRWCIWKKRYDAAMMARTGQQTPKDKPDIEVIRLLEKDKAFLINIFRRVPTFDDIKDAFESRSLPRWTKLKKLSPFYSVLSPWVKKLLNGNNIQTYLQVDLTHCKVTATLESAFRQCFPQEG